MEADKIIDPDRNRLLTDMGPIYHETDLNHLDQVIVEPFNAFSSLAMAIAAIAIWIFLVRKDYREYPFLAYLFAPLIFVGGIGSTLFHGFRSSQFFLLMDWFPILLLTILLSLHYWYKIFPRWYFIVGMIFAILFVRILPIMFFTGSAAINISYFTSGLVIIIPMIIFMIKTRFAYWQYVALSVIALLLALFFRFTDDFESLVLPMGTHWLWHVFSGIGAWCLGVYMYKTGDLSEELIEHGELILQRAD